MVQDLSLSSLSLSLKSSLLIQLSCGLENGGDKGREVGRHTGDQMAYMVYSYSLVLETPNEYAVSFCLAPMRISSYHSCSATGTVEEH